MLTLFLTRNRDDLMRFQLNSRTTDCLPGKDSLHHFPELSNLVCTYYEERLVPINDEAVGFAQMVTCLSG